MTPASGRFLPDTNIVIALLEGDDGVLSNLVRALVVFIPAVALGELFFGAAKSGRPLFARALVRANRNRCRPEQRVNTANIYAGMRRGPGGIDRP